MAKYECPFCDWYAHTSGGIPNPNEWLLMSAKAHDQLPGTISSSELINQMTHLFKCVSCDGIAIFWKGFGEKPTWYKPRDD